MEIQKFIIKKLHGLLNYELQFKDNNLILIGENGSCKSTIIKMLFYTLSFQWTKLAQYNFDSISILIDKQKFTIKKTYLNISLKNSEHSIFRLPPMIRQEIYNQERNGYIDMERMEMLCRHYDIPLEYLFNDMDESHIQKNNTEFKDIVKELKKYIDKTYILYLPTYRRIEQDIKTVLAGRLDEDNYRTRRNNGRGDEVNYSELIEFGMDDVQDIIDETRNILKDSFTENLNQLTLGYLGEIVDEKYRDVNIKEIINVDDTTIQKIMNRVDVHILSDERKTKLSKALQTIKKNDVQNDHDRVVCHYFIKLLNSHRELEKKELNIRKFVEICSKYLSNKKVIYDSPTFDFYITPENNGSKIGLSQLSSGEKQIVSLFSHLYLDGKRNYLVLIDEPELSLSVKWQRQFLSDIHKGNFCTGIIAVTHSPFIFDNELDSYAHGVNEFIK